VGLLAARSEVERYERRHDDADFLVSMLASR
jgi:hypothetical protein